MAAEGGTVVRGAGEEVVDALRGEEDEPLEVEPRAEVLEGRPHAVDAMLSGEIDLVINTAHGVAAIQDSLSLRQTALTNNIPYYTTVSGSKAAVAAIRALQTTKLSAKSIQNYLQPLGS